ncbi:MAG: NAD-binding protein [Bradyrhizobium sp.]
MTSLPSAAALASISKAIPDKTAIIIIETSTLPIPAKEKARQRLAKAGVTLLDCPLSGTGAQAKTGDLVVFASGISSKYRKTMPVLKVFSRSQYYLGKFGNGSKMKFAANLLVAIHNVSSAEAIILARRSGLDPALAVRVLGDGAGASRMLQVRGPLMVRRSYRPATVTNETWRKDMKIIGAFVRGLKSPAPLFNRTRAIYREALRRGFAQADTAAVAAVLERKRKKA